MKNNISFDSPTGSLLVGMAAGAALGAVGTMAATREPAAGQAHRPQTGQRCRARDLPAG